MTLYPSQIDTDNELPAIDDNVTEWSGEPHNKLREAVLVLQKTLGINPHGTTGSVADRLNVSLNSDGTLSPSAITSLGLLTNITNSQIDTAANINESKLNLDYNTSTLKSLIDILSSSFSAISVFTTNVYNDLISHTVGVFNKHHANQIDTSAILNKDGYVRSSTNVMDVLLEINNDLITHLNSSLNTHAAVSIFVDSSNFEIIPQEIQNAQEVLEYIDSMGKTIYGEFGAILNSNGLVRVASTEDLVDDGYHFIQTSALPVRTIIDGTDQIDDVVEFDTIGGITANELDALFSSVSIGDYITINYGGYVSTFNINSILFEPQSVWNLKIDGVNLEEKGNADPAYAYIEKKKYNDNTFGSLAVCPANHSLQPLYDSVPSSVIIVPPRSAQVLGMDLNLADLDSTHYNLYIDFYPLGNVSKIINLPPIDVTGNQGITPGQYTLEQIIRNVNKGFRAAGYNYRMVAFEKDGQFGLAIGDYYGNPGFSIRSGAVVGGVLVEDLPNNVIGNDRNDPAMTDVKDALGLGNQKANVASPAFALAQGSLPTKVFVGKKNKKYNVFGDINDVLAKDITTNEDGYWFAEVYDQNQDISTITTTYVVEQDLANSKIRLGSTIVVLPQVEMSDSKYNDYDYGRFIVKKVEISCPPNVTTEITVINGISGLGLPRGNQTEIGLPVKIYHCDDSVTFDTRNLIDSGGPGTNTKKLYEIFINGKGETTAYERLRLPITVGEQSYITTEKTFGWHVVGVSEKLKGYLIGSNNRRQLRISVSNYNSSDQSFQLQILNPSGTESGPAVIGKKDEVIRVYDHTGVDYIEIVFEDQFEDYSIPNTNLDCEVFITESQNEEFMCVGSCIQMHLPDGANGGLVFYVNDRRQFGTVNERILSDSAISFIESNNRLLHENSIINGFEFKQQVGDVLVYNGGIANVNGKIISKNPISFTIFPIALDGSNEYDINIVLCLDDKGNIWWAPLTEDGTFSTLVAPVDLGFSYNSNIKAYPFEYIVNNRKDLVPFSIVTITSKIDITVPVLVSAEATDIRKFMKEAHPNNVIVSGDVLGSDNVSKVTGNFETIKAAVEYAYAAGMNKPKICIKGVVNLDEEIVLSDMILEGGSYNLIKVGENGKISILGNVKIDGLNFQREFDNAASAYINDPGKGTIVVNCLNQNTYSDIIVQNCVFNTKSGNSAAWIPHILFEQNGSGATIKNVTISNNTFNETFAQFIIGFIARNSSTTIGTVLNGVVIEKNKSNHLSTIMINSDANGINSFVGLEAYGLKIHNNMFGELWLNACRNSWANVDNTGFETSTFSTNLIQRGVINSTSENVDFAKFYNMVPDVSIGENNISSILTKNVDTFPAFSTDFCKFTTAFTKIYNNTFNEVKISINMDFVNSVSGNVMIYNNMFFATEKTDGVYALFVSGNNKDCVTTVNNNTFIAPNDNYKYNKPIYSTIPINIHNNIIDKCIKTPLFNSGIGISVEFDNIIWSENEIVCSIKNNIINRGTETITNYIYCYYADVIKNIDITNNTFDNTTTNGTSTDVIMVLEDDLDAKLKNRKKIRVIRNINQTFELDLMPYVGNNLIYSQNIVSIIGWGNLCGSPFSSDPEALVISTLGGLDYVSNGSYFIRPLNINIPFIEDCLINKIEILIDGYKPVTENTYPFIYGTVETGEGTKKIDYTKKINTNPSVIDWNTQTTITVVIENHLLGTSAVSDYIDRKSISLFLYFSDNLTTLSPSEIEKNAPNFDFLNIKKILATYRY